MVGVGVTPPDRESLLVTGVGADISDGILEVTPPDRASLILLPDAKAGAPVWVDWMCVAPPDCRLSSSKRSTGAPSEISPPDRMGGVTTPPVRLVEPVSFLRETLALALGNSAPREVPPSDTDPIGMDPLSEPVPPPDRLTVTPVIDGGERPPPPASTFTVTTC